MDVVAGKGSAPVSFLCNRSCRLACSPPVFFLEEVVTAAETTVGGFAHVPLGLPNGFWGFTAELALEALLAGLANAFGAPVIAGAVFPPDERWLVSLVVLVYGCVDL